MKRLLPFLAALLALTACAEPAKRPASGGAYEELVELVDRQVAGYLATNPELATSLTLPEAAWEMGMYEDDPLSDVGRLVDELFRAVRLVVDTGIHHRRWTREEAIDSMTGVTGKHASEVVPEIERYMA